MDSKRRKLIITAPIMTGDIPHVAGAMVVDKDTDVLLVFEDEIKTDDPLVQFLTKIENGKERVKACRAEPSPNSVDFKLSKKKLAVKLYLKLTNSKPKVANLVLDADNFTKTFLKYNGGSTDYKIIKVSAATEIIAQYFKDANEKKAVAEVHKHIADSLAHEPTKFPDVIMDELKDGVFGALPPPDAKILLLWARYSGQPDDGNNPAGDSDVVGQDQLSELARETGFTVVRIGHGPSVGPQEKFYEKGYHLGEFYENKSICNLGRAGQVSFFIALKKYYTSGIIQMGQKTGGMDFGALIGIPTLYIEDQGSLSKKRMTAWTGIGGVPFYRCALITKPPSSLGKALRLLFTAISDVNKAQPNLPVSTQKLIKRAISQFTQEKDKFRVDEEIERTVAWLHAFKTHLKGVPENVEALAELVKTAKDASASQIEIAEWKNQIQGLGEKGLESAYVPAGYLKEDVFTIKAALESIHFEVTTGKFVGNVVPV